MRRPPSSGAAARNGRLRRGHRRSFQLLRAQRLAMRTVAAHLRARQNDLKSEVRLDLPAEALERLAEELFDFAAAQTDDVGMLLLAARLVVVLLAGPVHEIELVDQAAFLENLQSAIDGH